MVIDDWYDVSKLLFTTKIVKGFGPICSYSNISNHKEKARKWKMCHKTCIEQYAQMYLILQRSLNDIIGLKKYQNKAIRVYYTNERESKKSTSSPTFIYLTGHNPPYHTRPRLSYIKGKILSIYQVG